MVEEPNLERSQDKMRQTIYFSPFKEEMNLSANHSPVSCADTRYIMIYQVPFFPHKKFKSHLIARLWSSGQIFSAFNMAPKSWATGNGTSGKPMWFPCDTHGKDPWHLKTWSIHEIPTVFHKRLARTIPSIWENRESILRNRLQPPNNFLKGSALLVHFCVWFA